MNMGIVIDILRTSIYEIVIIGAPLLLAPMIIGLIVSIFQATTQIQEQTLTFVPKMIPSESGFKYLIISPKSAEAKISPFKIITESF